MIPLFWIKTAGLFLVRSRRTTLALGLMISCAVGVLIFISAIAVGINDTMINNSTGLYSGQITGIRLPDTMDRRTLFVNGVSIVLERFHLPGRLDHQGKNQAINLVAVHPDPELKTTVLWKKIISGSYLQAHQSQILISQDTAEQLGVHPGQPLLFTSGSSVYPLTVAGIFKTGIDRMDHGMAFCPAAILSGKPDTWEAAVFLTPGTDPQTILDTYEQKGLNPGTLKTWKELMPDLTQLIELNHISMGFVMVLVLGVVSFGTACAFAIFIISNIREYGIMKAMGVTPAETTLLIFSEVILMNLVASAVGTMAGFIAVLISSRTGIDLSGFTSHNPYFVVSGLIIPRVTSFSLLVPSVLSISFCLAAAVWPVRIVIRQRTSQILRSR